MCSILVNFDQFLKKSRKYINEISCTHFLFEFICNFFSERTMYLLQSILSNLDNNADEIVTDNDNKEEIIILSSLSTEYTRKKYNYNMYYGGFEMSVLKVDDKRVTEISVVTRHVNKNGYHVWLDSFSTCDIQNNGSVDLVWEKIGEGNYFPDLQYSSDKN